MQLQAAHVTAWALFLPGKPMSGSSFNPLNSLKRSKHISSQTLRPRRQRHSIYVCANSENDKENVEDGESQLSKGEQYRRMLLEITAAETALSNPYGTKMSYEVVRFDEDGIGPRDRYVYVEERDCIGCTHCSTTAPGTFFMEEDYGRARVFNQTGDIEMVVEEAIDTCPVNCIYYVDWDDLVKLEIMRKDQVINNCSRLVGGQDISSSRKGTTTTKVMDSGLIRCEDCPGRGCPNCPLYGVGQNPEYLRKKAIREAKAKTRIADERKRRRKRL